MKLAPLATAFAVVIGISSLPRVASAGSTRVVVAGPEHDPIASRVQKELVAMGFDPVRVDDATASCSRGAVAGWIDETRASAATCSDGTTVAVWIVAPGGLRLTDVVAPPADASAASEVVATRAAEITRASLELADREPVAVAPAPSAPPPAPEWKSMESADRVQVPSRRTPPATPRTPSVTMGAGVSAVMGADATSPAANVELGLRVHRYLALTGRAEVPLVGATVGSPHGGLKVAPAVFGLGTVIPLASPDALVIPRLGAGLGVVWLRAEALDPTSASAAPVVPTSAVPRVQSVSVTSSAMRDDIFSPMIYGNAAISIRVAGPFRIALDGLLGTTAQRMVVRDAGVHVAYWGQPFGTLAIRGELLFR